MIVYKLTSNLHNNGKQLVIPLPLSGRMDHDWAMDMNNSFCPIHGITDCVWLVPGTWEYA